MTEQNELLEAALKLAETFKSIENKADWSMETQQALDAIEKHRPKPEPLECWANLYKDGSRNYHTTETAAQNVGDLHGLMIRRAVHLREVTPAPEWERWRNDYGKCEILKGRSEVKIGIAFSHIEAGAICSYHNAEMARVTGTEGK
jgi:hypothetical protein